MFPLVVSTKHTKKYRRLDRRRADAGKPESAGKSFGRPEVKMHMHSNGVA